jgi:hypothetical protein
MHFVTDYVIVEREIQKKKRRRDTFSTIGVLIPTLYLAGIVYLIIVFRGV